MSRPDLSDGGLHLDGFQPTEDEQAQMDAAAMPKLSEDIFAQIAPHDHEGPTTEEDIRLVNWGMAARALEEQDEVHWKTRRTLLTKLERMERARELALNAMDRAQPTTHELDGAIVIWEVAWKELEEALTDDLSSLPSQQKPTEEGTEGAGG